MTSRRVASVAGRGTDAPTPCQGGGAFHSEAGMGVHPARSALLDHLERHRSPSIRSAAIADIVGRNIVQRRQGGSPAGCSNTADPAAGRLPPSISDRRTHLRTVSGDPPRARPRPTGSLRTRRGTHPAAPAPTGQHTPETPRSTSTDVHDLHPSNGSGLRTRREVSHRSHRLGRRRTRHRRRHGPLQRMVTMAPRHEAGGFQTQGVGHSRRKGAPACARFALGCWNIWAWAVVDESVRLIHQ